MQSPPAVTPATSAIASVPSEGTLARFCDRHYRTLALLALALAAFNLGFRLNREIVTAWDESLYATTAAEMVRSGNWLVTTFHGEVDYYNSKPPLNVWLIAASFKLFGISLWSLRLPSVIAAWLTIAVLQRFVRQCFGALTALATTIVLSTTFAFLYVHAGRSGNPDAWLTLDIVLTVITLWSARRSPARLVWLGPLATGAFLLKGTAVLLPLLIVGCVLAARRIRKPDVAPLLAALALFVVSSGAWVVARWQFDRWRFFDAMVNYDFVARATRKLEGHDHGWLYYLNVLQKDHYDWLATALVLLLVIAVSRREHKVPRPAMERDLRVLLGVWAAATLLVPTMMATKLAWYLNPFYPVFALAVAAIVNAGFATFAPPAHRRERLVIATMVLLAFGVAEGKLVWYSYAQRDIAGSVQGFFIESREVRGHRVLQEEWDPADHFVLEHIAHGLPVVGNPRQVAVGADQHDLLILQPREGGWTLTNATEHDPSAP